MPIVDRDTKAVDIFYIKKDAILRAKQLKELILIIC
jgi:hypothetical protein